jgi:ABC-type uncharacterized transport system ATPase subunit
VRDEKAGPLPSGASDMPPGGSGANVPAVELRAITKRFPGVVANRDVSLTIRPGEVHAIVGENGAGKSTLMKILYGMQRPDAGEILIGGEVRHFRSPGDAITAGIGMVHQHFMLADNLTVLENVVLGAEPTVGHTGQLDLRAARKAIAEISDAYGLGVKPNRLVEELGVGDRQRVEILKVLYRGARVLILDEPTAVLVPQEVDELFRNLAELRREGLTVVFISHKLDEVLAVADAITVMRAGTTVATVAPGDVTAHDLAELMVGSELPVPQARDSTVTSVVQLAAEGLVLTDGDGRRLLDEVTLRVHRGEIVGVAGVEGNGQAELVEAVIGLRRPQQGTLRFAPAARKGSEADALVDITQWDTRRRREAGMAYIPEDRHRQGLLLAAPLWENRILGHQTQPPNARGPLLDLAGARRDTARILAEYDVRAPGPDTPAFALSGGNQQKLIVGREMSGSPSLLIASHPTRGIDVGAQAAIWEQVRQARAAGLGVLLVSADLEELLGLSDTLLVMLRGRLVAELDPATVTPEQLGSYMMGARA